MKDRITVVLPQNEKEEVQNSLQRIQQILSNYLIALTPKERMQIPKMSDGTIPFVEKSLDYTKSNKEYVPPYLDAEELERDVKAVEDLTLLHRVVKQLNTKLEDTIMLAGSEAYIASLSFYKSVKMASKLDVPGAKTIYTDLRQRFAKSGEIKEEEDQATEE